MLGVLTRSNFRRNRNCEVQPLPPVAGTSEILSERERELEHSKGFRQRTTFFFFFFAERPTTHVRTQEVRTPERGGGFGCRGEGMGTPIGSANEKGMPSMFLASNIMLVGYGM